MSVQIKTEDGWKKVAGNASGDGVNLDEYKDSGYLPKNLINPTTQTTTVSGVSITRNSDGTYTVNGTASDNISLNIIENFKLPKGTYKMVGCPVGGSATTHRLQIYSSGIINTYDDGNGIVFTLDSEANIQRIILRLFSGKTYNGLVFKPMISTDLTSTYNSFIPYAPSNVELQSVIDTIERDEYTGKGLGVSVSKWGKMVQLNIYVGSLNADCTPTTALLNIAEKYRPSSAIFFRDSYSNKLLRLHSNGNLLIEENATSGTVLRTVLTYLI